MFAIGLVYQHIVYGMFIVVGETPSHMGWAETPRTDRGTGEDQIGATPTPGSKRRSRWDETPSSQRHGGGGATPVMRTPSMPGATPNMSGVTPAGAFAMNLQTPSSGTFVCCCLVCIL